MNTPRLVRHAFGILGSLLVLVWSWWATAAPPITALTFTADGKGVLVGSQAGVEVRSWPDLEVQRKFTVAMSQVHDIAVFQDKIAVVGGEPSEFGTIEVFDDRGARPSRTLRHQDVIYAADWSANGSQLATAGGDALVIVGGTDDDDDLSTLVGHSRAVLAVQYIPDTPLLATGGRDHSIRIWNTVRLEEVRVLDNHRGVVRDLAVRPQDDGLPMIASAGADRTVRFWQPTIGRMVRYARLRAEPLSLAWTPDGRYVAVGCIDGQLRVLDAENVTVTSDRPVLEGWVYEVRVAHDGTILIAGAEGKVQRLAAP